MVSSKKTELILQTYELLKNTPPEEIKIREIAKACDCTTTVIYKHFKNLDDLVCFASIRFLEDYIASVQTIITDNANSLDILVVTWREFAKCAFQHLDIYLQLFWGRYKSQLGDAIHAYYQLFPDEWNRLGAFFASVFFNSEIKERNFIIVRRAASEGYFPVDDAKMISDMQCYIMHGALMDYQEVYRLPGKAEEGFAYFMEMLNSSIEHYRIK